MILRDFTDENRASTNLGARGPQPKLQRLSTECKQNHPGQNHEAVTLQLALMILPSMILLVCEVAVAEVNQRHGERRPPLDP